MLSSRFTIKDITIREFAGKDSYVRDLDEVIGRAEMLVIIGNSFTKINEHFNLRKLGPLVQNRLISSLDETMMDLDPVPLLLQ